MRVFSDIIRIFVPKLVLLSKYYKLWFNQFWHLLMIIGYARVSTQDQHTFRQIDQLKEYGCERIYEEKASGGKRDRNELNRMMDALREGDRTARAEQAAGAGQLQAPVRYRRHRQHGLAVRPHFHQRDLSGGAAYTGLRIHGKRALRLYEDGSHQLY